VARIADHFGIPERQVTALLNYAHAYPDEIQAAIDDNDAAEANLKRWVPNLEIVRV
jgi:hypothetical protein